MKRYDFDTLIPRIGTGCVKWDKPFQIGEKEVLPLWVADMDFPCSDEIQNALHKLVDQQIYGYGLGLDASYRKAICSWFLRRFDWKINPKTLYYAGGVVPAIAYLLECLCEEGDGVIVQTPVYYPFMAKIKATKRVVVENPLCNTNGIYSMDFDHLKKQFARDDVKGMILCSPHNPVGRVWTKSELLEVVHIAKTYGKWIISDEIHCDIIRHDKQHISLHTIAKDYIDEIIVCTAPSKSFNLAGLQNSNIIITKEAYQKKWEMLVIDRLSLSSPNCFALAATKAAYNESEEWLNQVNAYIDDNIEFVKQYVRKHLPKAIVSPCEGTYLLWIDVRAYTNNEKDLEACMLKESIVLDEGYIFGSGGAGFERLNLACPRSIVEQCMQRFCHVLKNKEKETLTNH